MKKILPIIIGITCGLIVSTTGIKLYNANVAYGELNWWNEVVAFGESLAWKDIFGHAGKGKDLYTLIYIKNFVAPEKNALTDIAKKYGLTTMEAKSVAGGSIVPLLNTSYKRSPNMTQEQAIEIMQNVKESYEILTEAYSLQQEADSSISPNEIFANNDLADSGFDLIYDLSKIEEVLFVDVVPNTIGKPYVDGLKSPYLPTEDDYKNENYVSVEPDFSGYKITPSSKTTASSGGTSESNDGSGTGSSSEGSESSGDNNSGTKIGEAIMPLSGKKIVADVVKDACVAIDAVSSALANYEKESSNKPSGDTSTNDKGNKSSGDNKPPKDVVDGKDSTGSGDKKASGETKTEEENVTPQTLAPAPKDDWVETWCNDPNVSNSGSSYEGLGTTFGDAGFTSLGDTGNSLLNNSSSPLAGAGVGFTSKSFSAQASVCLTIKLVKKTLSSYYPGKSCVLCEVKKINDIMKKTLDHSLLPNKITGNMLESAKCKSAMEATLFDMKFVVIKAPIPTSSSNDLVFGKNIFESWKKFIDRYQPLLLNYLSVDKVTKFQLENAPSEVTQEKIFNDIQKELAISTAEAKKDLSDLQMAEAPTNTSLYAKTLIKEFDFMTQTFENYKDLLEKTNTVCQEWGKKPNIQ